MAKAELRLLRQPYKEGVKRSLAYDHTFVSFACHIVEKQDIPCFKPAHFDIADGGFHLPRKNWNDEPLWRWMKIIRVACRKNGPEALGCRSGLPDVKDRGWCNFNFPSFFLYVLKMCLPIRVRVDPDVFKSKPPEVEFVESQRVQSLWATLVLEDDVDRL